MTGYESTIDCIILRLNSLYLKENGSQVNPGAKKRQIRAILTLNP